VWRIALIGEGVLYLVGRLCLVDGLYLSSDKSQCKTIMSGSYDGSVIFWSQKGDSSWTRIHTFDLQAAVQLEEFAQFDTT
jgi:hypothetical protein